MSVFWVYESKRVISCLMINNYWMSYSYSYSYYSSIKVCLLPDQLGSVRLKSRTKDLKYWFKAPSQTDSVSFHKWASTIMIMIIDITNTSFSIFYLKVTLSSSLFGTEMKNSDMESRPWKLWQWLTVYGPCWLSCLNANSDLESWPFRSCALSPQNCFFW